MANIDLEKIIGTDEFPSTENDVLGLIETIASQRITALRSANRLIDATFEYDVENGKVVQEAVIEMAKSYAYDKDAYSRAPSDPTLHVRYFSDYTERQFEVTVRRDDIRAIIANKGQGVEDVIAQILSTLTYGEGHEDFENVRALIMNEYIPDYSAILGGVPKTIKGAIYAARNMYNHLKSDNSDLTEGAGTAAAFVSSTPAEDIRVAITEDLLNLMDVVELSNIFNLQKEELFGILVVVPSSDLEAEDKYKIVVYDRKAMGRATFIYDFTQEEVARGRYRNEYLTVSRCYFYNELFKAAQIDCYTAAIAAIGDLIDGEPGPAKKKFVALESTDYMKDGGIVLNPALSAEEINTILSALFTGGESIFIMIGDPDDDEDPRIPYIYAYKENGGVYKMIYTDTEVELEFYNSSLTDSDGRNLNYVAEDGKVLFGYYAPTAPGEGQIGEFVEDDTSWNGTVLGKYEIES